MKTKKKREMGQRISTIRQKLGLTQQEFANKFDPPASKGAVSRWENGDRTPSNKTLKQIAELGNVSVDYLQTGFSLSYTEYRSLLDKAIKQGKLSDKERQKLIESQLDFNATLSSIKQYWENSARDEIEKQQAIFKVKPMSVMELQSYSDMLTLFNSIRLHGSEEQKKGFRVMLNMFRQIANGTIKYDKDDIIPNIDKFLSSFPVKKDNSDESK